MDESPPDPAPEEETGGPRASTWWSIAVGGLIVVFGATMPWFVVGPASRLGLADDGWLLLIAGPLIIAGAVVTRATRDARWLALVWAGVALTAIMVTIALVTPPEAMTVSAGSFVSMTGAVIATVGAVVARRGLQHHEIHTPTVRPERTRLRTGLRWLGHAGVAVAAVLVTLMSWPIDIDDLDSRPDPTSSYEAAIDRFEAVTADEPSFVYEPCRSRLLTHDEPTDVVVVLFHGLTNCPRQYVEIGEGLFDQGANVVILRAPGHGHATDDGGEIAGAGALHGLTARQLADYGDDAIDIALGLGGEVRVHGLSMGGVMSLWASQYRPEVDQVVAMAPAFELPVVPNAVSNSFTNLFSRTPSITRSHERRIDHDYAAFSTRGLAASFALGQAVMADGLDVGPIIDDVTVLLNPDDPLVNEHDIEELVDAWDRTRDVVDVVVLESSGLPHDAIDVAQPEANPDLVYPVVFDLLGFEWDGS